MTGEVLSNEEKIDIYPAKHFVTPSEKFDEALSDIENELEHSIEKFNSTGQLLEAERIKQRTKYDIE